MAPQLQTLDTFPATGASPGAWLRSLCWDRAPHCVRCGAGRVYRLKDSRYRCPQCGYTFHDFSRRWIGRCALPAPAWLQLMACFARGRTAKEAAEALDLAYNTAHKAFTAMRLAIFAATPEAKALLDGRNAPRAFCSHKPAPRRGEHCQYCRSPVFAVIDTGSVVRFAHLDAMKPREVMANPLAKNQWLVFLYTDRFQDWEGLVFSCCRFARRDFKPDMDLSPVHMDIASPFWAFAKPRLARYHCITPETTPLYLKEMEFRFNHRHEDLVPLLARLLCAPVPDRKH